MWEWWERGAENARRPQGWPSWVDMVPLYVPFWWPTVLPPWAKHSDIAHSCSSDPTFWRNHFKKEKKKVLKREKALFEICHSQLDLEIVRNSSLHILVWAQFCTSSAHCIKKRSPIKIDLGLSGILASLYKPEDLTPFFSFSPKFPFSVTPESFWNSS